MPMLLPMLRIKLKMDLPRFSGEGLVQSASIFSN